MLARAALFSVAVVALAGAKPAPLLSWAFLGVGEAHREGADSEPVARPGSDQHLVKADLRDMTRAPDRFPGGHPPAPRAVLVGAGGAFACGYCHLPNGVGRPENARLQGLPESYIVEQVQAFAEGTRRSATPDYAPTDYMTKMARAVSPDDLHAAATYFAGLEPRSTTRVVEAATIPRAIVWGYTYRIEGNGREVLGERIVEGPADFAAFESRDPRTPYIAYVPPCAIARARQIAVHGAGGGPACVACHGASLAGMGGGSPTYVVRQLAGFRSGMRHDPGAGPMLAVASRLTDAQIIDVASYAATRRPWTRAELTAVMNQPPPASPKPKP